MARKRLSMRKIREILRLKAEGLSICRIAQSLGMGHSTVGEYLERAERSGITWPVPEGLDDEALQARLFRAKGQGESGRALPDWAYVHAELRRKHVTLALLWQEYREQHPEGYKYSQFCTRYRRWAGTLGAWMRQEHKAGEKLFVDYSGDGIPMIDPLSGERVTAQLFVAVLGASNYTYAEATATQTAPDWLGCHVHALEFLGGVPGMIVPDQTKTGIKKPCRYDPDLNPAYQELAKHFDTCVVPARPGAPRDKAKVESGVLLAQRWIIAVLRNRILVGLDAVNAAIKELLERLNNRPMRKLGKSRRQLFEELDKPALKPLPAQTYEFAEWKIGARVNLDYHVEFDGHFYSVSYHHIHKQVDIRATARAVEVFLNHIRIASHQRSRRRFGYTTLRDHMPRSHQKHLEWTPSRIIEWGKKIGPATAELLARIMEDRPHPEQGYRACLGVIRLEKRFTQGRVEKACARAVACRNYSYRAVESILKHQLEERPLPARTAQALPAHENVRGSQYYA